MKKLLLLVSLLLSFSTQALAMPIEDEMAKRTPPKHNIIVVVADPTLNADSGLMGKVELAMKDYFPQEEFNTFFYTDELKAQQQGVFLLAGSILAANKPKEPSINQLDMKKDEIYSYSEKINAPLTTIVYISTFSLNAAGSHKSKNLVLRADTRTLSPDKKDYIYVDFIDSGTPKRPRSATKTLLKTFKNHVTVPITEAAATK